MDNLTAEGFITGFHVGQVQVGKYVGQQGQHTIANLMPEIDDPVGAFPDEARTEHDIRFPLQDGIDYLLVFLRVVFQFGILIMTISPEAARRPLRSASTG